MIAAIDTLIEIDVSVIFWCEVLGKVYSCYISTNECIDNLSILSEDIFVSQNTSYVFGVLSSKSVSRV